MAPAQPSAVICSSFNNWIYIRHKCSSSYFHPLICQKTFRRPDVISIDFQKRGRQADHAPADTPSTAARSNQRVPGIGGYGCKYSAHDSKEQERNHITGDQVRSCFSYPVSTCSASPYKKCAYSPFLSPLSRLNVVPVFLCLF